MPDWLAITLLFLLAAALAALVHRNANPHPARAGRYGELRWLGAQNL